MDWNKQEHEASVLVAMGYEPTYFAYQTGGGEDENDMTLYVKENLAVRFDYQKERWYYCSYDSCNYINGFDYDNEELFSFHAN